MHFPARSSSCSLLPSNSKGLLSGAHRGLPSEQELLALLLEQQVSGASWEQLQLLLARQRAAAAPWTRAPATRRGAWPGGSSGARREAREKETGACSHSGLGIDSAIENLPSAGRRLAVAGASSTAAAAQPTQGRPADPVYASLPGSVESRPFQVPGGRRKVLGE